MLRSKRLVSIIFIITIVIGMTGIIKPVGGQIRSNFFTQNSIADGDSAYDHLLKVRDEIESACNSINPKSAYIELYGLVQRISGRRLILDADINSNVAKLDNNYLTFYYGKSNRIKENAASIIELKTALQALNIDLLYVQPPHKISKYDPGLPYGVVDFSNENMDAFLTEIGNGGVDYLDLRQIMHDNGINQYDMFFQTDHHWTPQAGLWATGIVSEQLNKKYDFQIPSDLYNPDNYTFKLYKDYFLGSQGKRVGTLYAGVDDITLITPKFETNLDLNIPARDIHQTGNFENALLFPEMIEEKDYYGKNPYVVYIGGDRPLVEIENKLVDQKKILVVRDSYAIVFTPFMALGCSELDEIDLRHYTDGSLIQYIKQSTPDIVIFMYSPSRLNEISEFDFGIGT